MAIQEFNDLQLYSYFLAFPINHTLNINFKFITIDSDIRFIKMSVLNYYNVKQATINVPSINKRQHLLKRQGFLNPIQYSDTTNNRISVITK